MQTCSCATLERTYATNIVPNSFLIYFYYIISKFSQGALVADSLPRPHSDRATPPALPSPPPQINISHMGCCSQ